MGICSSCGSSSPVLETAPLGSDGCAICGNCTTCNLPSGSCGCPKTPCQEDHTHIIKQSKFAYTLRTFDTLTWPAVNESTSFRVDSVERIAVGTILYYPPAGYLHVTGFDCVTQIVTVENLGEICNVYTGGEQLPPCTDFAVGPPTCVPGSTPIPNIPYLAADFTSPDEGNCQLASVTNIVGLTIEDVISLNGFLYRIGDIIDSDTIELCNDGEGAPVGIVIEWDPNGDATPDVPVVVISSGNPCTRTGVNAGVLLVCDELTAKPLVGTDSGEIPIWDAATERFVLRDINLINAVVTDEDQFADAGPVLFAENSTEIFGTPQVTILNTSLTKVMKAIVHVDAIFTYRNTDEAAVFIGVEPQIDIDGAGWTDIRPTSFGIDVWILEGNLDPGNTPGPYMFHYCQTIDVNPGASNVVSFRIQVSQANIAPTDGMELNDIQLRIVQLGVAV